MCAYEICPMVVDGLPADCRVCPYADGTEESE